MLIDSHCHLDRLDLSGAYQGDLNKALDAARAAGVGHLLAVSINLKDFPQLKRITAAHKDISLSAGVHPCEELGEPLDTKTLLDYANEPRVVALGETGLDFYFNHYQQGGVSHSEQIQRFREHIAISRETGKPLIVHTRSALEATIDTLKDENADQVGGVLHCFTEDWPAAERLLALNFYISISGIVTFKNAHGLKEVARAVPLDKILIETDSPYLAPVPHRGKPNEPAYVRHVAKTIAQLRNMDLDEFIFATGENFKRLFKITT